MKSPGRSVLRNDNNAAERGSRPVHSHKHRICHPVLSFCALFNPIPRQGRATTDRRGQPPMIAHHRMVSCLRSILCKIACSRYSSFYTKGWTWNSGVTLGAVFPLVRVNYVSPNVFSFFFFFFSCIHLCNFREPSFTSRTKWTRLVYQTIDSAYRSIGQLE